MEDRTTMWNIDRSPEFVGNIPTGDMLHCIEYESCGNRRGRAIRHDFLPMSTACPFCLIRFATYLAGNEFSQEDHEVNLHVESLVVPPQIYELLKCALAETHPKARHAIDAIPLLFGTVYFKLQTSTAPTPWASVMFLCHSCLS